MRLFTLAAMLFSIFMEISRELSSLLLDIKLQGLEDISWFGSFHEVELNR